MLSTSKEQATKERGSSKISEERKHFKHIPMPVRVNCGHTMSADVRPFTKHSALYQNVIFTIIVLIILSISKSYSALPTDLISPTTTVSSVFQSTIKKVNLLYDTKKHSKNTSTNKNSISTFKEWTKSANTTSVSIVDNHVANSSVFSTTTLQTALSPTKTVTSNPLQINGSSWSINNATKSTTSGDHSHQHHPDLISHLHCEVSTGQKSLLIESKERTETPLVTRFASPGIDKAT